MAIDYDTLMAFEVRDQVYRYDDREVMLYAISVGYGRDPLAREELPFVYEGNLKVAPSFASVAQPGSFRLHELGVNFAKILHGEYQIQLFRPLPPRADLLVDASVAGVWDKGQGKGALLTMQADVRDQASGEPLYRLRSGYFCRGDGGFLKPGEKERNTAPVPHPIPERAPDVVCESETRIDQALLYRLTGDRNPLHADPDQAQKAGFDRPILHGVCTYGICSRAVLKTICDYDTTAISAIGLRFSQPVYPGETIVTEMWKDGAVVSFRAFVKERGVMIVNNGRCDLKA